MKPFSPENLQTKEDRTKFRQAALLHVLPELSECREPKYFQGQDLLQRFDYLFDTTHEIVQGLFATDDKQKNKAVISSPRLVVGEVEDLGLSWPVTGLLKVGFDDQAQPDFVEAVWELTEFNPDSRRYYRLRQAGKSHRNDQGQELGIVEETIRRVECVKKRYLDTAPDPESQRQLQDKLNEMAQAIDIIQRVKSLDDTQVAEKQARRRGELDMIGKAVVETLVGLV